MDTIPNESPIGRRRRRIHSVEFKANIIAACKHPGVSTAAVAMANGVNANLVRRWIARSERANQQHERPVAMPPAFVAVRVAAAAKPALAATDIRVELRRGETLINVTWPPTAAAECAAWMRELLR